MCCTAKQCACLRACSLPDLERLRRREIQLPAMSDVRAPGRGPREFARLLYTPPLTYVPETHGVKAMIPKGSTFDMDPVYVVFRLAFSNWASAP